MNDFTIFISSCDNYADTWQPFFTLLLKHGGSLCNRPICLCSETKSYTHPTLSIDTFLYHKKATWSKRVKAALSTIKTEYILFIIDDYFLLDPINEDTLQRTINYLNTHKDVGYLAIPNKQATPCSENNDFAEKLDFSKQRLYLTVSFWRTDYMKKILRDHESIWDFERYSVLRAPLFPEQVMQLNPSYPILYHYMQPSSVNNGQDVIGDGYGVVRGKWLRSTKELFDKHGINVDYENLGWYQPGLPVIAPDPGFLEKLGEKNRIVARIDRFIQRRKRKFIKKRKRRFIAKSSK